MNSGTLVSVIIPTTRRPDLVQRALQSVFSQTHSNLEIIVVVDGPNPETMEVLARLPEPRLKIIQNDTPVGAGAARNRGAASASGAWLAFLDDDDAWVPEKIERQIQVAEGPGGWSLVSCSCRVFTPEGTYIWPRQLFDGSIPVDEYLFDRRTFFRGETTFATPSILVSKSLFDQTGFGTSRQNEDTTLLLRVTKQANGRIIMLRDPLVILYQEEQRESLGSTYSWREMLVWLDEMDSLITKRAYSGFCLIYLGSQAARHRDYSAFFILLSRSFRRGKPRPIHVVTFLLFWILPIGYRRRIRALVSSIGRPGTPNANANVPVARQASNRRAGSHS